MWAENNYYCCCFCCSDDTFCGDLSLLFFAHFFSCYKCRLLLYILYSPVTNPISIISIRQRKQTCAHSRDMNPLMQQLYFYEPYYSTTATLLLHIFPVSITHIMSFCVHRGILWQHSREWSSAKRWNYPQFRCYIRCKSNPSHLSCTCSTFGN